MRFRTFSRNTALAALIAVASFTPGQLSAQIHKSPADTGRLEWGHKDMTSYTLPSMCDRAASEFLRYYSREYKPDTSLAAMLDSTARSRNLSDEGKQVLGACFKQFTHLSIPSQHLWGYIRSALLLDDDSSAIAAIERVIDEAPDSALLENAYTTALLTFLYNAPRRMDLFEQYLERLDKLTPLPSVGSVSARVILANYWNQRYYTDSVDKYARSAINIMERMPFELREKINATTPYLILIELANNRGDLIAQDEWLKRMEEDLSDWGGGGGVSTVAQMQTLIDFRKSLYGKRINRITDGIWFNDHGEEWPVTGKVSIIVLVDHLCTYTCYGQYRTIRRLKTIFGDDLSISLTSQSAGYSIGTPVLDEQEEGDSIVSLFTHTYDMPYALLLDPRPIARLPDGRIIRDIGPVAEMFSDWNGMNAVIADQEGRIQWMGSLAADRDRRPMINTLRRFISNKPNSSTKGEKNNEQN